MYVCKCFVGSHKANKVADLHTLMASMDLLMAVHMCAGMLLEVVSQEPVGSCVSDGNKGCTINGCMRVGKHLSGSTVADKLLDVTKHIAICTH